MDKSDALGTNSNDELIESLKEDLANLIIKLNEAMDVYSQSGGEVQSVISEAQAAVGDAN